MVQSRQEFQRRAVILCVLLVSRPYFNPVPLAYADNARREAVGHIERLDPALDKLVPRDAKMEVIAEGFEWCESPAWVRDGEFLLFSDIPRNSIMRWDAKSGSTLFLKPSG